MSKKRYIYTIDDDCFVAKDPSGESINALQQHIRNLLTPSTPRFFNTLYDPFAEGADFVRGYPFSWRQGAPTAVSHGEHFHACGPWPALPTLAPVWLLCKHAPSAGGRAAPQQCPMRASFTHASMPVFALCTLIPAIWQCFPTAKSHVGRLPSSFWMPTRTRILLGNFSTCSREPQSLLLSDCVHAISCWPPRLCRPVHLNGGADASSALLCQFADLSCGLFLLDTALGVHRHGHGTWPGRKCLLWRAGLWLNIPDYDAPTQMVKPHERNTRYVDAVMTIPKVRLHLIPENCTLLEYTAQKALRH